MSGMQQHVLMYHHVAPLAGREALLPYLVAPETFCRQLDAIVSSRLPVLTMQQLARQLDSGGPLKRSIVLTFDDCARDLWSFAIPEMDRRGLKGSFYAVSSLTGGQNSWDDHRGGPRVNLMTSEQLKMLVANGHEVGAHGVHHRRMDQLSEAEVLTELVESRRSLQSVTELPVETMTYPFGAIPERHAELCMLAGFRAACSIFSCCRVVMQDRFAVRRTIVHEGDVGWRFRCKLSLPYLWLRSIRDPRILAKTAAKTRLETDDGRQ